MVTTSLIYITQSHTGKTIMHTKWGPNENYHSRFSYTCILVMRILKGFFFTHEKKQKKQQMHCSKIIDKLIKTWNQSGSKIGICDTSEIYKMSILY